MLDAKLYEVDSFDLLEDGSIWVEISKDYSLLFWEGEEIDLLQPYSISGTTIVQADIKIDLQHEHILDYLKLLLKDTINATKNTES